MAELATEMITEDLQRAQLLYGTEKIERLARTRALLFGVGGVGSWCAEALVRSGLGALTMVDADVVDVTNINRQCPATSLTVGLPKAQVMAERLKTIRPECEVNAIQAFYTAENQQEFHLEDYDVVIDAIDSVASKAALILQATSIPSVAFYSSMGAARRIDPTMVRHTEFWKVKGCPLARALRDKFKREETFPRRKFQCVYSEEPLSGSPKGTSMPVTATFGLTLASLAINQI